MHTYMLYFSLSRVRVRVRVRVIRKNITKITYTTMQQWPV